MLDFKQARRFARENTSKRMFIGQDTPDTMNQLANATFNVALLIGTFGLYYLVLRTEKPNLHPGVFVSDTSNPISEEKVSGFLNELDLSLKSEEVPHVLINTKKNQFVLFTNLRCIYQLHPNKSGKQGLGLERGQIKITNCKSIKMNNKGWLSDDLPLMIDDEIIGCLQKARDQRIQGILKCVEKDVREKEV